MNGICLIWSRGRLISPSLPVGDDRYLNLSSQKLPTGRNLGGNRLVRRSSTTFRGTVFLVFFLLMRRSPLTPSSYHIRGNEMNCVGSSEYMTVFMSFTRASFLSMRADQSSSWLIIFVPKIDHFVTILHYYSLCKMSKDGDTSPLFKILFFKNIWIYLRLIFLHCSNQS